MFRIIDALKLEQYSKDELEKLYNPKTMKQIELLYELDGKISLISNAMLLDYQNTNFENYPFIMKDFIHEINKSTDIIIDAIIEVLSNCKEIIVDEPTVLEHKIILNEELSLLQSIDIRNLYVKYLNEVNQKALVVRNYLKSINSGLLNKFERYALFVNNYNDESKCLLEEGRLKEITVDNIFQFNKYQAKREAIVLNLGDEIKKILGKNRASMNNETINSLKFFSYDTNEEYNKYFNELYYSINLFDEKILEKKSQLFFYELDDNQKFEVVGKDIIKGTKKSTEWTYEFICDFNIDYYIKKYLVEQYTKKDMFSFMCLYKDFLSSYNYINFTNKNNFNQKHPKIMEANLLHEVNAVAKRYKDRLQHYYDILVQVKEESKGYLIITKGITDWVGILKFPEPTKRIFINRFSNNQEPTIDEINSFLNEYGNKIIESEVKKVLDTDEKEQTYSKIKRVLKFFDDAIENIYYKLYYIDIVDEGGSGSLINKHFTKRDRATFQTTLKDSLVFDLRKENLIVSENTSKLLDKYTIERLVELLKEHKYHDYIEIDSEVLLKDNTMTVDTIIAMLEKINMLNIPVPQKCALKFRKLGNYKASGIYFSFAKQLGVDYRIGMSSYIHELAHHIDLNTKNENRNTMLMKLHDYFDYKIDYRREYYLKNEELIARAAEVSMILLLGRYEKYKEFYDNNEINEITLYNAVISAFEKHKFSQLMGDKDTYSRVEYINILEVFKSRNFELIDFILVYFKSFWGGKEISKGELKRFSSNSQIEYTNENKFVKKNEYSYKRFYRNLFEDRITY